MKMKHNLGHRSITIPSKQERRRNRFCGSGGFVTRQGNKKEVTIIWKRRINYSEGWMSKAAEKKLVVPLLQIQGDDASKKKTIRQGRRNYYTHKMGAGYKSRCSDLERWQQYTANEYRWASSATNFTCPFRFLPKDAPDENGEVRRPFTHWTN